MGLVVEKDLGWERIKKELQLIDNSVVNVGVLQSAGSHTESGVSIASIAVANEYGVEEKNIPERPFMRIAYDENSKIIESTTENLKSQIYEGKRTVKQALGLLGELHVGQIKQVIGSTKLAPNDPKTIARKGSSAPLIDEGQLLGSINYEVFLK